jgi:hypothetical protein
MRSNVHDIDSLQGTNFMRSKTHEIGSSQGTDFRMSEVHEIRSSQDTNFMGRITQRADIRNVCFKGLDLFEEPEFHRVYILIALKFCSLT